MKKILFTLVATIWMCCMTSLNATAQNWRNYDCGLFNLQYPATFKPSPIESARHMILKVETQRGFFSFSTWDYDLRDEVSAWNDDIYAGYQLMLGQDLDGLKAERIDKVQVSTRSGAKKMLRISSHGRTTFQGRTIYLKNVTYVIIHKGFLIVYGYQDANIHPFSYPYVAAERILNRLKFK